jgi:Family of unknown function (DUF6228)
VTFDDRDRTKPDQVIVLSRQDPDVSVQFLDRRFVDQHETVFTIEAHARQELYSRLDVTVFVWDHEYLDTFLNDLADNFRGWEGERTWSTNHLHVRASFHSGGHIELAWTLRAGEGDQDPWNVRITTWLDGGEQMTTLATQVHGFLARP